MHDYSLYLVTDRTLAADRPLGDVVRAAVRGGVTVVQLREKDASARELLAAARELLAELRPCAVPLVVNDRVDVALACSADGVHVGQDDVPCDAVRGLVGRRMRVGVSVSTPEEARRAEAEGADYLGISPVFATPTKPEAPPPVGLAGVAAIRAATRLPLVAIGGIKAANAAGVVAAGANGVAVVSAIMAAPDPEAAAREIAAAVRQGRAK